MLEPSLCGLIALIRGPSFFEYIYSISESVKVAIVSPSVIIKEPVQRFFPIYV